MENEMHEFDGMKLSIEDGIIVGVYPENTKINLDVAKLVVEKRKVFSNYQTVPLFVDVRNVTELDKEARDYLSSREGYELLSASAIMSNKPLSNFLANFLIQVNLYKTPIPVKLFTNKKDAMEWLKKYV